MAEKKIKIANPQMEDGPSLYSETEIKYMQELYLKGKNYSS